MRRLLLLAVGCCAGALAQALTFDWEGAQSVTLSRDGTTGCYTGSGFDAVDGTRDFAIRLTLNFQAQGDANWFNTNGNTKTLLTIGDGRQDFTLYVNATAASAYRTWSRGDGSKDVSGERLTMALENEFIFAYDASARTLTLSQNGTVVLTLGEGNLPDFTEIDTILIAGGYGGDWQTISRPSDWWVGDVSVAVAQPLPEPTALAVLALGAAGLALRRRAA